ncbi:MAG: hypothetical protein AAFO07_07165 [Bacteroidota bacterium]
MKNHVLLFLSLCISMISLTSIYAQEVDTSKTWIIELVNENTYIGKIQERNTEVIVFDSRELGIITIKVTDVKSLVEIAEDRIVNGVFWADNPQATRYFLSSSGYGLRKGEGYYQNVWVFFNQFSFGITDQVSVGVGLIPLFLFDGANTPIWITPKVSIPVNEKFNVSIGALMGGIIGVDTDGPFGVAYGSGTFGTRDKNATLGLGYGFAGGEWASVPTITFSAMLRTGKKGYFITDNFLIDSGDEVLFVLSAGGRSVGKTISLDYGGFIPISSTDGAFIIPWLGISVPIGRKN